MGSQNWGSLGNLSTKETVQWIGQNNRMWLKLKLETLSDGVEITQRLWSSWGSRNLSTNRQFKNNWGWHRCYFGRGAAVEVAFRLGRDVREVGDQHLRYWFGLRKWKWSILLFPRGWCLSLGGLHLLQAPTNLLWRGCFICNSSSTPTRCLKERSSLLFLLNNSCFPPYFKHLGPPSSWLLLVETVTFFGFFGSQKNSWKSNIFTFLSSDPNTWF